MSTTYRAKLRELKNNPESTWFIIDLIMVALVIANFAMIVFDWLFHIDEFANAIYFIAPKFHDLYAATVHKNFVFYDMIFVSIYITEFCVSWAIAIYRKTYHSWFYYPFVHWYDLLGCIPIGSFRFLRILRVISIVYRLQKLGLIDVRNYYVYRLFEQFIDIATNEVTDRIVINVIGNLQEQIKRNNPVAHEIRQKIIDPHRRQLAMWGGGQLGHAIQFAYQDREEEVRTYLQSLVNECISRNRNTRRLADIPLIGSQIREIMEDMSVELVEDVLVTFIQNISDQDRQILANITDELLAAPPHDGRQELMPIIKSTVLEALDLVKGEVAKQHWKQPEYEMKRASVDIHAQQPTPTN